MRVGFVAGAFDLLHAGHIYLFRQAKKHCDRLIIGIHVDPSVQRSEKNKPIESIFERQVKVNTCKYVDVTVIYEKEEDISNIIKYFDVNVRFLGSDYKQRLPDGKPITAEDTVPIVYIDSLDIHSSEIREKL